MTELLSASLFLIAPLVAAAAPYFIDRYGVTDRLPVRRLPRIARSKSATLPDPARSKPASLRPDVKLGARHAVGGAIMFAVQVSTCFAFLHLVDKPGLPILLSALSAGLITGLTILAIVRRFTDGFRSLRPARALSALGLNKVYTDSDPATFRRTLLESVRTSQELEILCSDGLELLNAISHNARKPLDAPHPDLRGARVNLLLLPPKSGTIDFETRGRTTAEVAISRLSRSPEDHWRLLHTALEVCERWSRDYGLSIQARFLETRPAFRLVRSGARFWFQPWESTETWIETRPTSECALNRSLRGLLVEADAQAASTLQHPLEVGPSKTTFIKKGVQVPALEKAPAISHLEVEDCCEIA